MDRQIVYPGQILPETSLLQMTKDSMIGLAKLTAAILGTSTIANGFATTPTGPASLQVVVAPGEIYSLSAIDALAFSTLPADTTHSIMKQGILLDGVTLTCAAPGTTGQSINYLVQATYQDSDSTPVLLPYYNSANPALPYSGMGNNGLTQNTNRKGIAVVAAKAGASAVTGSQVTPAPDAGYVGLYVVTVAFGQTTITAGNISLYAAAPFITTILPNAINMAQIQTQSGTAFTTTGTAPAFALTPVPALGGYTGSPRFQVKFHSAGAGSDTINISGQGAKNLKQYDALGNKVAAVIYGQTSDAFYDGTDVVLLDPLPAVSAYPPKYIAGFALANNSGAPNTTLDVSGGSARNLLNTLDINLSSLTSGILQASGAWTAGSNQNKLDTGAKAVSTWYHVFAIRKTSDGSGDILFSLSPTAPTMPTGYAGFRRLGSMKTDASGNIIGALWVSNQVVWKSPPLDVNVTGVIDSAYIISVPTGVRTMARVGIALAATEGFWSYRSTDSNAIVPAYLAYVGGSGISTSSTDNSAMECSVLSNSGGGVYLRTEFSSAPLKLVTYGWTEIEL